MKKKREKKGGKNWCIAVQKISLDGNIYRTLCSRTFFLGETESAHKYLHLARKLSRVDGDRLKKIKREYVYIYTYASV